MNRAAGAGTLNRFYLAYLAALLCFFALCAEYVVLPWCMGRGVSRETVLMGFWIKDFKLYGEYANRLGFMGDDIQLKKAPGTIRILILGGSTPFGNFIPRVLKNKLAKITGCPVEVLNASVPGHTVLSDLIRYRLLSKYKFDYVCIYQGINDVTVEKRPDSFFREDYSHEDPWYKRNFLVDHSLICRVIYNKLINPVRKRVIQEDRGFSHLRVFEKKYAELVALIRKNNATPLIMSFAWYPKECPSPNEFNLDPFFWGTFPYQKAGVDRVNSFLYKFATRERLYLVDQAKYLDGRGDLFVDPVHFNYRGKERFVDNIVQVLADNGLLKRCR